MHEREKGSTEKAQKDHRMGNRRLGRSSFGSRRYILLHLFPKPVCKERPCQQHFCRNHVRDGGK